MKKNPKLYFNGEFFFLTSQEYDTAALKAQLPKIVGVAMEFKGRTFLRACYW